MAKIIMSLLTGIWGASLVFSNNPTGVLLGVGLCTLVALFGGYQLFSARGRSSSKIIRREATVPRQTGKEPHVLVDYAADKDGGRIDDIEVSFGEKTGDRMTRPMDIAREALRERAAQAEERRAQQVSKTVRDLQNAGIDPRVIEAHLQHGANHQENGNGSNRRRYAKARRNGRHEDPFHCQ